MSSLPEEILIEKEHIEKTLEILSEALERSEKTVVEFSVGFMLKENELLPLAIELPDVWKQLSSEIKAAI